MKRYKYMQRREQKQQICLIDFAGLHLIFIKENLIIRLCTCYIRNY